MRSRGRSEESRGKNVQSVRQRYNTTTTAGWLCWKRVKPERQHCVGCQGWKVLGRRGGWRICEVGAEGRKRATRRGKAVERGRVVDTGERRRERSGAFPRTVGPRSGVGCPGLISVCSGSGFSFSPALPKQRESQKGKGRGGRIKRETFVFFFFHLVIIKKKKWGTTHPIFREHIFFSLFFSPQLKEINKE